MDMDQEPRRGYRASAVQVMIALSKTEEQLAFEAVNGVRGIFTDTAPIGLDALTKEPEPIPMVIDGLLQADAFGFVGPGGAAKTTIMLLVMIHVILGRELWGHQITNPGPCLFVSQEDPQRTMTFRIHMLCRALLLNREDIDKIAEQLFIHDVSNEVARFVESDGYGNLGLTNHLDDLIALYQGKGIRIACFDPATYFGPGERYVNDGEALLMKVARRVAHAWGCAAGYIHHTGQSAARDKTIDQYAGRGGSAFADNSRTVWVLHSYEGSKQNLPLLPAEIAPQDVAEGNVSYLVVAKLSGAKRLDKPLWVIRDGFEFTLIKLSVQPYAREAEEARENESRCEILKQVCEFLSTSQSRNEYPTKNSIRENLTVTLNNTKIGKTRVSGIIDLGIQKQILHEKEIPQGHRQGRKKTYLVAVAMPAVVDGNLVTGEPLGE